MIDGQRRVCKLTLGALAEFEAGLHGESLPELVSRFEEGRYSAQDVLGLIVAGLRGGGWDGTARDLIGAEIEGGLIRAAQVAAELLARAFAVPS